MINYENLSNINKLQFNYKYHNIIPHTQNIDNDISNNNVNNNNIINNIHIFEGMGGYKKYNSRLIKLLITNIIKIIYNRFVKTDDSMNSCDNQNIIGGHKYTINENDMYNYFLNNFFNINNSNNNINNNNIET